MFRLSFAPDTLVAMPDGPVAINDLKVGDLVVSGNEEIQVSGAFSMAQVFARIRGHIGLCDNYQKIITDWGIDIPEGNLVPERLVKRFPETA